MKKNILTLGPLLYNWPASQARDFYLRVADEMDVDRVYIGEVVCSKRQPLHANYQAEVISRLQAAGKEVVLSTLALVMTANERAYLKELCGDSAGYMLEINDVSLLANMSDSKFAVGPYVNIYNEGTLAFFEDRGASIISLPFELPRDSLMAIAAKARSEIEIQVFGRMPLAISARCYHARAFKLHKDGCQFVCDKHADGMNVDTIDSQPFLTVNGTQTQSHTVVNLIQEISDLQSMGINSFRLSPHSCDMIKIAEIFRQVQKHDMCSEEGAKLIAAEMEETEFSNGFYHSIPGRNFEEFSRL